MEPGALTGRWLTRIAPSRLTDLHAVAAGRVLFGQMVEALAAAAAALQRRCRERMTATTGALAGRSLTRSALLRLNSLDAVAAGRALFVQMVEAPAAATAALHRRCGRLCRERMTAKTGALTER